jgi:hypothetical protein
MKGRKYQPPEGNGQSLRLGAMRFLAGRKKSSLHRCGHFKNLSRRFALGTEFADTETSRAFR